MLGSLTTKEASQLSRRLLAWKTKHKKSWVQAARDFSVSRLTLLEIRKGAQCRVETAQKICRVIGWKTFRKDKPQLGLTTTEELQRAAATGSLSSCPLLRLQALHTAASRLYLRLRLKGYSVQISLPDHLSKPSVSWVILTTHARLPLLHVEFHLQERSLKYRLMRCSTDGSPQQVGGGYLSEEGFAFCEEFLSDFLASPAAQTPRQRSVSVFNAAHQHARKRR